MTISLEAVNPGETVPAFFSVSDYSTYAYIYTSTASVVGVYNLRLKATAAYTVYREITFTWTFIPENDPPVPSFFLGAAHIYSVEVL